MVSRIINFYLDGFRSMRVGKKLWLIIFIKLFIMFVVLKTWFPDYLQTNFANDEARGQHVLTNLISAAGK